MSENEITIWGMHGGEFGEADQLFLKQNFIALGWSKMGDLTKLGKDDRKPFKDRLMECYPNKKTGAIPGLAGQLFRFVNIMKIGDYVAYPSKMDRQIHIGQVTGGYRFDDSVHQSYPHTRSVKWLNHIERTMFTQGALYEIGSAMSLFQIKNYAEEYIAFMEGKKTHIPVSNDETVAAVAEDIEETTKDFILKKLSQELKGHPFADFIGHLLEVMGYKVRVSPPGSDRGIDVLAHKDDLGVVPPIIKVQVKSGNSVIGDPELSALYGKVGATEFGLFVTLTKFSPKATDFARSKSNLKLIDGLELVKLIFQYYEEFDSKYKALLPLKRIYVPELIEEAE